MIAVIGMGYVGYLCCCISKKNYVVGFDIDKIESITSKKELT